MLRNGFAGGFGKAKEVLGYEPIVDFGRGLDVTMQWYRGVMGG